jgi:hypothetical protein
MAKAKKYVDGSAKEYVFKDGSSVINIWINLDTIKEKGLISKTKTGKNGLSFTLARRSEEGEYGDTHYMYVQEREGGSVSVKPAAIKQVVKPVVKEDTGEDDLPF